MPAKKCMLFQQNAWKKLNVGCCPGQADELHFTEFLPAVGEKRGTLLSESVHINFFLDAVLVGTAGV